MSTLPTEFADLEPMAMTWALPTERERRHHCASRPMQEIERFYSEFTPRISAVAAYLDRFPMGNLPDPQSKLFMLAQMYMEVAVCVEFLKAPEMGPLQIAQDRWHILGTA